MIVSQDKEKTLSFFHRVLNGKKCKRVVIVIHQAVSMGIIEKPKFGQLVQEFGEFGQKSEYSKYYNEFHRRYTDEEIDGVANLLLPYAPK